jgi:hypothetical protein
MAQVLRQLCAAGNKKQRVYTASLYEKVLQVASE